MKNNKFFNMSNFMGMDSSYEEVDLVICDNNR